MTQVSAPQLDLKNDPFATFESGGFAKSMMKTIQSQATNMPRMTKGQYGGSQAFITAAKGEAGSDATHTQWMNSQREQQYKMESQMQRKEDQKSFHDPPPKNNDNRPVNIMTTWSEESRIHFQHIEDKAVGPPPEWYEGESNWYDCERRMEYASRNIEEHWTGAITEQERLIKETKLQKAADDLYKKTNGKLGRKYEESTKTVEVADIFYDDHFPGDNRSWVRGGSLDEVSDLSLPPKWMRLYDLETGPPYPMVSPEAGLVNPRMGRIYQGSLEDKYLVQALFAVGTKDELIREVFANMSFSDPSKAYFVLRFYKNSQWVEVAIDDYLPMEKDEGEPFAMKGEFWPAFAWPSLIEKAYAKLHGSYENLGGGGHVEDVMVDLTGGCCGRFHTTDCAQDRLWKYFQELKRSCVWGCSISEIECSKRLVPIAGHWASAVYDVTKDAKGIPYIGVMTCAPMASIKHMPLCDLPQAEGYGLADGFMWLRADDFCQLFDAVYECRLVNSNLAFSDFPGFGPGAGKIPLGPGYIPNKPWYEKIWAFRGNEVSESCPSFLIDVPRAKTEIILAVGTTDHRYSDWHIEPERSRHMQAPLLVRFFQASRELDLTHGGEIYMVHMSSWGHNRDAACCVKVLHPGRYVATVSMPAKYMCKRMIFRTYASEHIDVQPITAHKALVIVNPGMPLSAIPYSMVGWPRIDAYSEKLPQQFDEEEGKGAMQSAPKGMFKSLMKLKKAETAAHPDEQNMGMRVVGKFGGHDAEATVAAVEEQDVNCSVM
mmetsp:Transcript_157013/g.285783  ORF Transcript_157013/g.285783 Transcript_157013/m.285783 type:complete len:771 (-) Transcript_157013:100-2412(-)